MKRHLKIRAGLICLALSVLGISSSFAADESYTFVVKKQNEKAATRKGWNLADWIAQRDTNRTRDLWLAMNTPTPYEFSVGGDYRFLNSPQNVRDYRLQVGAFAKIFGLTFETDSDPRRWNALFNVRAFGLHSQGTNLTLFAGLRSQTEPVTFRSGIIGAGITMYLMKLGGIETQFRKYLTGTTDPEGVGKSGTQFEANLFMDFRSLRVYGGLLQTQVDPARSAGYQMGLRFYF